MPVRHEGGEDMLANALGGLELSDREPRLGLSGMPHVLLGTMEVRYDACFQAALSGGIAARSTEHKIYRSSAILGAAAGGTAGLRRPGSHSSLSHGSGLHADDCLESEVQPRTIIIHNLIESVSDEDLQKDLEVGMEGEHLSERLA